MCAAQENVESKETVMREALLAFHKENWLNKFIFSKHNKYPGGEYYFILDLFAPYARRILGDGASDQEITNLYNEFIETL